MNFVKDEKIYDISQEIVEAMRLAIGKVLQNHYLSAEQLMIVVDNGLAMFLCETNVQVKHLLEQEDFDWIGTVTKMARKYSTVYKKKPTNVVYFTGGN